MFKNQTPALSALVCDWPDLDAQKVDNVDGGVIRPRKLPATVQRWIWLDRKLIRVL